MEQPLKFEERDSLEKKNKFSEKQLTIPISKGMFVYI